MDDTTEEKITIKYRLTGQVQGVGFRRYLQKIACSNNVQGWAKNQADKSLIVLLHGDTSQVGKVKTALRQGPPKSHLVSITELKIEKLSALGHEFSIR